MTTAAAAVTSLPSTKPEPAPMAAAETVIEGRIERMQTREGRDGPFTLTLVKMPAADEYSSPSTVELQSKRPLGKRGDEISAVCRVGGYPRQYRTKPTRDNPDGETVYTADIRLVVIG